MTLSDVKIEFHSKLHNIYPKNEISAILGLLLSDIGYSNSDIVISANSILTNTQIDYVQTALSKLCNHTPVQYIRQKADFYGLEFFVNPSVLIPRQETEILVHTIIHSNNKKSTIVDIGTGSGCIAITLAKHLPQAQVYAIDISKEALAVTKQNAIHHSVEIQCIEADMCNIDTYSKIPTCTTIVSNPPYICSNEKKYMNLNVLEHEPHTALFVPDNNPLQYYKALANIGLQKLETNGMLICEINEAYGIETKELFEQFGFVNCSIILDLHNKDRFLQAYKL